MTSISWWRSWHGAPMDPKWQLIAARAKVKTIIVTSVAWALMDYASQNNPRGSIEGFDAEVYAFYAGVEVHEVTAVIQALIDREIIVDGVFKNWEKRQPRREDDSTERVERYRNNRERAGLSRANNYNSDFIFKRDGYVCAYCGSNQNLVVDHIYPLSRGGTDDPDNLVCACKKCNAAKAGRLLENSGLHFINSDAATRYAAYVSRNVTQCHAPDKDKDKDTDTDTDTESSTTAATARPEIFKIYEREIGALTPMIADALIEAEKTYPRDWFIPAFREAADHNARSWKYVETVLKRWRVEGFKSDKKSNGNGRGKSPPGKRPRNEELRKLAGLGLED